MSDHEKPTEETDPRRPDLGRASQASGAKELGAGAAKQPGMSVAAASEGDAEKSSASAESRRTSDDQEQKQRKRSLLGPGAPSAPPNSDPRFLFGLMDDATPLEVGYEEAAQRGQPCATGRWRAVLVAAAVVCGLMLGGAANAMRDMFPGDEAHRVEIQDVKVLEARNAEQRQRLQDLEAEANDLAGQALRDEELRKQWDAQPSSTESVAVRNPGIQIILTDPPEGWKSPLRRTPGVTDKDLQAVVNLLWAVGAEAISVNDQRIVSSSSIRVASGVIGVNYQRVSGPYRITALGDPRGLLRELRAWGLEEYLHEVRVEAGIGYEIQQGASYEVPAGPADRRSGGAEGPFVFATELASDGNYPDASGYGEGGQEGTP